MKTEAELIDELLEKQERRKFYQSIGYEPAVRDLTIDINMIAARLGWT